jgi:hypothetical protein
LNLPHFVASATNVPMQAQQRFDCTKGAHCDAVCSVAEALRVYPFTMAESGTL